MDSKDTPDINVATLLALRQEPDGAALIAERLKVKDMGPADHIRTKHEVKTFVDSGDAKSAEELLQHARERRALNQTFTVKLAQQRAQRIDK